MIKPLRKYHFAIWRILAFVFPVVFSMALILRPRIDVPKHTHAGIIIATRPSGDSLLTVTIEVLSPVQAPSCVVYANDHNVIIGTITTTGKYSFNAPVNTTSITLFDKIHHVILKTHNVGTDQMK